LLAGFGCTQQTPREQAAEFLREYESKYQQLFYESSKAAWVANTDISDEHDSLSVVAEAALSNFAGSKDLIGKVRALLADSAALTPIQMSQLHKIFLFAAHRPGTIPLVVDSLIKEGTKQTSLLYSFDYRIPDHNGNLRSISTNEIDDILVKSADPSERLAAWTASKEVGPTLRPGLANLQRLRNRVAREMGFSSYFDLEVADYGMTSPELMAFMDDLVRELRPLYQELHTYARYELAKRYKQPVPDELPAHWLPNRWGQNWPGIIQAIDLDDLFKGKSKEWVVHEAELFYLSLGFPKLAQNFWDKSDLYPVEPGSSRKKNNHASAWHLDLANDYRSLMSVVPDADWFATSHHELGHIYYFIEYSNPDVPLVLREGANRSYHEGMGDLMSIASMQRKYLEHVGLLDSTRKIDQVQWLLNDALSRSSVVIIPFAAGTMSHFEHDLYENDLPEGEFNARWWEYVRKYQGIIPPGARGEEFCDPATKTHIIDDAAQYYDYALSCVLKFHLHNYIATQILHQDPRNCNYYGNTAVGDFLKSIMRPGASKDWRKVLKERTGEDLSAKAMLAYYRPLMDYLKKENKGRESTLPPL